MAHWKKSSLFLYFRRHTHVELFECIKGFFCFWLHIHAYFLMAWVTATADGDPGPVFTVSLFSWLNSFPMKHWFDHDAGEEAWWPTVLLGSRTEMDLSYFWDQVNTVIDNKCLSENGCLFLRQLFGLQLRVKGCRETGCVLRMRSWVVFIIWWPLSDCNTLFFVVIENTGSAFAKGRGQSLIQSLS